MAFCVECGTKVENNEIICSYCGKEMKAEQNAKQELFTEKISSINNTPDSTQDFDAEDIRDNKRMALLSYLSWLVIIPLISGPKSKYARYHMNQGLVLAILRDNMDDSHHDIEFNILCNQLASWLYSINNIQCMQLYIPYLIDNGNHKCSKWKS